MPNFTRIAEEISDNLHLSAPVYQGSGAYKEVFLCSTSNHIQIALKILDPSRCNLMRAEREIAAMQKCQSSFIAQLLQIGTHANNKIQYIYVIEEFIAGGTLANKISSGQLTPLQISDYGICLVNAINHLRNHNVVHRDIKPDNIMFRSSGDSPLLVDFGLVRDLGRVSLTHTFLQQGPGTPYFASPEQLNNDKHLIDWRSDQFSLGVVLSICFTGQHPYAQRGMAIADVVQRVATRGKVSNEFSSRINGSGLEFLGKMVGSWPVNRFSDAQDIIQAIEDFKRRH